MINQNFETVTIPNDYEAEQAVLGSIIYNNETINNIINILTPVSFYTPAHQHIYRAMIELVNLEQPIDELLLGDQLKSLNQLEEVGGYAYLATLQDCIPSSSNIKQYAEIIQKHALLRQLITITSDISAKSRDPEASITDLLIEVENKISEISSRTGSEKTYKHLKNVITGRLKEYEEMTEEGYDPKWNPTGLIDLDKRINGLQAPKVMIIAGRPSMGKTAFALNIAERTNATKKIPGAIVIFTYEMSSDELGDRFLTTTAKINYNDITNNNLKQNDYESLHAAVNHLSPMNIYLIEKSIPVEQLKFELKKIEKIHKGGIGLVILDYLQLIPVLEKLPREQQIAKISRTMKLIAKEFNTAVIPLSQLNRKLEERKDKRPMMSDLRESGALEQDADIIIFLYRDEVYHGNSKDKGIIEAIIAKQRNGPVGIVKMSFNEYFTRFDNLSWKY